MKKFTVLVQFVFSGKFFVNAETQEEADKIVKDNCGMSVLGNSVQSIASDDEVVDWDVCLTPDMEVLSQADEDYVASCGNKCPHCGSEEVESSPGFIEIDNDYATQEITCLECHREWLDQYRLVGFTEKE